MTSYLIYQTFPKSLRTEQLKKHIYTSAGWIWVPSVKNWNIIIARLSQINARNEVSVPENELELWDSDAFSGEFSF